MVPDDRDTCYMKRTEACYYLTTCSNDVVFGCLGNADDFDFWCFPKRSEHCQDMVWNSEVQMFSLYTVDILSVLHQYCRTRLHGYSYVVKWMTFTLNENVASSKRNYAAPCNGHLTFTFATTVHQEYSYACVFCLAMYNCTWKFQTLQNTNHQHPLTRNIWRLFPDCLSAAPCPIKRALWTTDTTISAATLHHPLILFLPEKNVIRCNTRRHHSSIKYPENP